MTTAGRRGVIVAVLVLTGVALGWLAKAPCLTSSPAGDGYAVDWQDGRQYSMRCYSDTIPLYALERLQDGDRPYRTSWPATDGSGDRYMEYPVVTGMLQYVVMRATKAVLPVVGAGRAEVVVYFTLMALVLALAWVAAVLATAPLTRPGTWDIVLVALSPLVMVHLFTNFDALAVALAAGGMLAWTRDRPVLAGVLLGLGAAAKLYPLFVLGPLLVLGLRTGVLRPWWRATGAAIATWLAVNLPIAVLYPQGWAEFFRLNSTRVADHDSIYNAVKFFTGWEGFDGPVSRGETPSILNLVSVLLFVAVCAGVAAVALTAPRRPRVASLVFLVVAGFLLTNKVWSPQYSLWLVPLAVLALPRWRLLVPWMIVDAAVWFPRMDYFLHWDHDSTRNFLLVVLLRDAVVLALCAVVLRDVYRPEHDPVRRQGPDDPAGGVYDGAPDRPVWRRRAPDRPVAARTAFAAIAYRAGPGASSS